MINLNSNEIAAVNGGNIVALAPIVFPAGVFLVAAEVAKEVSSEEPASDASSD